MELSVNGKVVKVLPPQQGEGKNGIWVKQSFVIETSGQYPKKICLIAWNDKADIVKKLQFGEEIKAEISIESREYNERWYTDIRALNITRIQPSSAAAEPEDSGVRFMLVNNPPPPGPDENAQAGGDYDLPF